MRHIGPDQPEFEDAVETTEERLRKENEELKRQLLEHQRLAHPPPARPQTVASFGPHALGHRAGGRRRYRRGVFRRLYSASEARCRHSHLGA